MIIGLSGYARAGKDTVADRLVASHGYTKIGFADALKEALYALNPLLGWEKGILVRYADVVDALGLEKAKDTYPEIRKMLQRLGTEVGRGLWGEDFWVERLDEKVWGINKVVIPDCRFPNEAAYVQAQVDGGRVWRIHRPGVEPARNEEGEIHESEIALDDWGFDAHLINGMTVAALHEQADYLVEALL